MAEVHLSRRALLDLEEIRQYSVTTWGEMVASDYLQNIEDALNRLRQNPGTDYREAGSFRLSSVLSCESTLPRLFHFGRCDLCPHS